MKRFLKPVTKVGSIIVEYVEFTGFFMMTMFKTFYYFKRAFIRRHVIVKQMYLSGVRTLGVISIVALFTGMILTLQSGITMKMYHIEEFVGNLVIATMTREMGPFSTAIILIAAVGSAMTAEIGTMKVSEEIDALNVMSISPVDYLVMPRVIGLTLMTPIATVYTIFLGCIGGAIIAKSHLHVSYDAFYFRVLESLYIKDMYVAMFKSAVFGLVISTICCSAGLKAENGAMGVGKATRDSVVASFLMILIVGYFITEAFYQVK